MGIEKYSEIEKKFFQNIKKRLGDNLLLYCVTGSLAREEIISGWSDIDVLIVYEELNADLLKDLNDAIAATKNGKIKIGLTMYSLKEFNGPLYKDPKTYHNINFIIDKKYQPRIISEKIKLKKTSNLEIIDDIDVSKAIHKIKRQLLLGPDNFNESSVYKLVSMIMKICLRNYGINVIGYRAVLEGYRRYFNFDIPIKFPEEIMANPIRQAERYLDYLDFIKWLENHKYWRNKDWLG